MASISIFSQSINSRVLGTSYLAGLLVYCRIRAITTSPRSVTCEGLSSSPINDFTRYRHKETTVPVAVVGVC
jgi:hypothetical protein